jgi:NhaA family Na+:H+ antiporter
MSVQPTRENFITAFFRLESAGGIILVFAAALALLMANSPLSRYYDLLLGTPVVVKIGDFAVDKPLLLWINDGLMAIFFFLVGLELKREVVEGELSTWSGVLLPAVAAIGGMVVPALIYLAINSEDPFGRKGWAIPAATDIAFALGVLSLLGPRVPISLKVFLTSLAIFDDIGAIVIIALFYTSKLSYVSLAVVAVCIPVLFLFNRLKIDSRSMYLWVGLIMWTATLKSGVHATLAGVVLAMFIPIQSDSDPDYSPLRSLEHDLHSLVAYLVLPAFAFANAGISLAGVGLANVVHPVPLGIAAGLFIGKQVGIFGLCWLVIKAGWIGMPRGMNMASLYGASALCGIGFTMSLFISSLAFEKSGVDKFFDERLGIILGSLLAGVVGYVVLRMSLPAKGEQA